MAFLPLLTIRLYLLGAVFSALGIGCALLPDGAHTQMVTLYGAVVKPKIETALKAAHPAQAELSPSDQELLKSIEKLVGSNGANHHLWEIIKNRDWAAIFEAFWRIAAGGFAVAYGICLIIPAALTRRESTRDMPGVEAAGVQGTAALPPEIMNRSQLAFRARALRVAVCYAVLSGLATLIYPPHASLSELSKPEVAASAGMTSEWQHLMALVLISGVVGGWATYAFSDWKAFSMLDLAGRLSFGGVLLGSVIALCIAMPYQFMSPVAASAAARSQIGWIVTFRLVILPAAAFIAGFATLVATRRLHLGR